MVNGEEKNGSSTLDVSDDSSSRVSFEESVCSRSKGMLRGMTASRKAISTSKVPKHARTMLQIRARRRNASYTPRYTSFGKRFSPPCSSLARCIILWCFSGFLLYKCLVSSFWQKFDFSCSTYSQATMNAVMSEVKRLLFAPLQLLFFQRCFVNAKSL